MSLLDWFIIIGIAITILLFIAAILSLLVSITTKKKLRNIEKSRPKEKGKKKKWRRKAKILATKQKKYRGRFLVFLIMGMVVGIGTGYGKYYASTNLNEVDTENLVYGYFLIDQMEDQLKAIDGDDTQKTENNVHELAIKMSSYSSKSGSDTGTEEAQLLLNRYYARLGQYGINLAAKSGEELQKEKEDYLDDMTKIRDAQKQVLNFYKINETSLKQKK